MSVADAGNSGKPLEADWHAKLLASLNDTGVTRPPHHRFLLSIIPYLFLFTVALGWAFFSSSLDNYLSQSTFPPDHETRPYVDIALAIVGACLIGPIRVPIMRYIRQIRAVSAEEELETVSRRPILYLRSFNLDEVASRATFGEDILAGLVEIYFPATAEERLVKYLGNSGPVIAVGRPGEEFPTLGAARFYVTDERWQEKVTDIIRASQIVVWVSGTTEGLRWELTHLIQSIAPKQFILWAHPHLLRLDGAAREAEWQHFREKLGGLFPQPLPEKLGETRFFYFDSGFTPVPVAPEKYSLGNKQSQAMRALMKAKGLPFQPNWHWRSDNKILGLALGCFASLIAWQVIYKIPIYIDIMSNPLLNDSWDLAFTNDSLFDAVSFGLWGSLFVLSLPLLRRVPGGYYCGAFLFGIVRFFADYVTYPIFMPLFGLQTNWNIWIEQGLSWPAILAKEMALNDPTFWLDVFLAGLWSVLIAILLRILPAAPGRPKSPYRPLAVSN